MPSKPPDTQTVALSVRDGFVPRFRLKVESGPDAGETHESAGERVVIGTHPSADLELKDRTVSRFHCDITVADQQFVIRDLKSRNGTMVDTVLVREAVLAGGADIGIGRTRIRFDLGDDQVEIPMSSSNRFGLLVGRSARMRATFALLEAAAASDATALLEGETGTGKEAAAESIHQNGKRKDGPFIVVDCGAIPANLLESELFGHERGAFTGAVAAREGAFEAADGGTIFLDEIGELSTVLQPKLLRALERKEIKRVGTNQYRTVDVRVIAATNRNLRADVNSHQFRSDLYYRLAVLVITLPPLRDRPDDLAQLVEHFCEIMPGPQRAEAAALFTPEFVAELARHTWPGNVRELRNYLERCIAMHVQAPLLSNGVEEDVFVDVRVPLKQARQRWTATFEKQYLQEQLEAHDGNVAASARAAGVDRSYFYRLLWTHGLK